MEPIFFLTQVFLNYWTGHKIWIWQNRSGSAALPQRMQILHSEDQSHYFLSTDLSNFLFINTYPFRINLVCFFPIEFFLKSRSAYLMYRIICLFFFPFFSFYTYLPGYVGIIHFTDTLFPKILIPRLIIKRRHYSKMSKLFLHCIKNISLIFWYGIYSSSLKTL
jgi:hypothetical protein